jgi:NAD(P)-dependent dehydrogenase (short-subunit alcohol dehydrogenase family)
MQHPKEKYPKPGKTEQPQTYPGSEHKMVTKPVYDEASYKSADKLKGKRALVTGGDSGIGRAVAVAFAKEGADVAIAYMPEEEEDARETIQVIQSAGRVAVGFPGDLRVADYRDGLINAAATQLGGIDVLVNNAGLQRAFKSFEDITAEMFEEIFRVNVVAPFVLAKAAAAIMQPGSAIVNTVSIQAYDPSSFLMPYAVSKSAFVALTKTLSQELIEKGIRVNAVAPGPIWSPLNTHGSPPERLKKFGEQVSMGRPGQPIELAPVYVLLASNEASYITGEIYGVTGGSGIA